MDGTFELGSRAKLAGLIIARHFERTGQNRMRYADVYSNITAINYCGGKKYVRLLDILAYRETIVTNSR